MSQRRGDSAQLRSPQSKKRENTARKNTADSGQPHQDIAASLPLVIVCDADAARAQRVAGEFSPQVSVIHVSRLDQLEVCCQAHSPTAVFVAAGSFEPQSGNQQALLQFLQSCGDRHPVFIYAPTNRLADEDYCELLLSGARRIIDEDSPDLLVKLRRQLHRLIRQNAPGGANGPRLQQLFAHRGFICRSQPMLGVMQRAVQAAKASRIPVLILGETGTGKQEMAQSVHRFDAERRNHPLVAINCSTITASLAESELFGHVRGAFTGAENARKGAFQRAHRGTLFLDEIGELTPQLQPKLLRVLEDGCVLPVGADNEQRVDVRVIAATNRSLIDMVAHGRFRRDLYERLNVFPIQIPPLRERPEDIAAQARYFLKKFCAPSQFGPRDFSARAMQCLLRLRWDGNTRELENVVREIVAGAPRGRVVELDDLPRRAIESLAIARPAPPLAHSAHPNGNGAHARTDAALSSDSTSDSTSDSPDEPSSEPSAEAILDRGLKLAEAMEQFERLFVARALDQNNENQTQTAQQLGISRRALFNKIRKFQR